jgi:hypothetical protein
MGTFSDLVRQWSEGLPPAHCRDGGTGRHEWGSLMITPRPTRIRQFGGIGPPARTDVDACGED